MQALPVPPALDTLIRHPAAQALRAAAGESAVHLVGGALRDALLGAPGHDLDAVVAGDGERIAREVARRLEARFVDLGRAHFATYRLVTRRMTLDIWDRKEVPLEADLLRRDFTVNAMALDLETPALLDPADGRVDLEARRLRATTPGSFEDDPLRVLRLARFVVQLRGFSAEKETVALARRAAARLETVAAERIREELSSLWGREGAPAAVELLRRVAVYPGLWSEAAGAAGAGRLRHALAEARRLRDRLAPLATELQTPIELELVDWGMSFHALDPPDASPGCAVAALEAFRDRGYLGRRQAKAIAWLLALPPVPEDVVPLRQLVASARTRWATAAVFLAASLPRRQAAVALGRLEELIRREGPRLIHPPRLVSGEDVCRVLGVEPGPEVGRVLEEIESAQAEGKVRDREGALAWLRQRGESRGP